MLKVNCSEWGQTPEDLRRLSLESAHPRTRERFFLRLLRQFDVSRVSAGIDLLSAEALACLSMANNFDPLPANNFDPPGGTKNSVSQFLLQSIAFSS